MLSHIEIKRARKIIEDVIKALELDLTGITVLTEVGSGPFIFTPIIAALANAKQVYAWTKDSSYGKGEQIVADCKEIINPINPDLPISFAVNARPVEHIRNADIITNSGFVRPLNEALLMDAKSTVVIPVMYEAWELRSTDIDITYCKNKRIKVAGTWENHPALRIFDFCGPLALKMCFEAGYEVFRNRIIVWSDDHFGEVIEKSFRDTGASLVIQTTDPKVLKENIQNVDFIFFADYSEQREVLEENSVLDIKELLKLNPTLGIVHLYGKIDFESLKELDVKVYPAKNGKASSMSFTLSHVGLVPSLSLIIAGFKVGEILAKGERDKLSQPLIN